MSEREKIIGIIAPYISAYGEDEAIADALIAAGIGDVTKYKEIIRDLNTDVVAYRALSKADDLEQIIEGQKSLIDEYKHRAEVAERALVIIAERVLEYAQKAKVTAMTSDGLFSYDKDAQLALLVNDALLKAEQKMARKENNESDF